MKSLRNPYDVLPLAALDALAQQILTSELREDVAGENRPLVNIRRSTTFGRASA